MRTLASLIVIVSLVLAPSRGLASQPLSADVEIAALKQMAASIAPGTRIEVQTKDGRRITATFLAADADRIVVKRNARVPEPAVGIAFADLARLEREPKNGFSVGKAIGIGLAAGVGAILTLFAIMVTIGD